MIQDSFDYQSATFTEIQSLYRMLSTVWFLGELCFIASLLVKYHITLCACRGQVLFYEPLFKQSSFLESDKAIAE